jgi:glucosyl-3-phosphoglycerate phosphatase
LPDAHGSALHAGMILVRHGQSEFNVVFSLTRQDPGIRDPRLTPEGRRQAEAAAEALVGRGIERLIASPYSRALETAEIVARRLDVLIAVEPLVGERAAFACDVGTPRADLGARWPHLALDHLAEEWWPVLEESEDLLSGRCAAFRAHMRTQPDWARVAVVSHWGFIRGLTGLTVGNGAVLRIDPHRPEAEVEILHAPGIAPPR